MFFLFPTITQSQRFFSVNINRFTGLLKVHLDRFLTEFKNKIMAIKFKCTGKVENVGIIVKNDR